MQTYEFTLVMGGITEWSDEALTRLYDYECGDATFGVRDGVACADFYRDDLNLTAAIRSAILDVTECIENAYVARVDVGPPPEDE